jgi:hypothetical protein
MRIRKLKGTEKETGSLKIGDTLFSLYSVFESRSNVFYMIVGKDEKHFELQSLIRQQNRVWVGGIGIRSWFNHCPVYMVVD